MHTYTHTCARVTPSPHTPTHTHIVAHEVAAAADAATSVLTLQYLGCALVRLADSLVVRVGLKGEERLGVIRCRGFEFE